MSRYFNFWVVAGATAVGLVLLCITILSLWIFRPNSSPSQPGSAVVNVIPYQSPTAEPATPTAAVTGSISEGGTPPSPPSGNIATGAYVQVTGTGGDGLRLRSEPGLAGEVKFLGLEAEVFLVKDGPLLVDGYSWWFLAAPYDESIQGWAVSNYLQTVQSP
jgi:hypothetical protein